MTDLLLRGARVLTMDPGVHGEAVLVSRGRIAAVGPLRELARQSPSARPLDLDGCLLLPGLTDTHTHFFELARRRAGVDLAGAVGVDEVRARLIAHRARLGPQQRWIGGGGWDLPTLQGQPGFDRSLLDAIFPEHAVALESRDFHTLWCNTRALEQAGVLAGRTAPAGGAIGRGPDGAPDGFLYETAWELIYAARPDEPEAVREDWVRECVGYAHSLGLTGFHSMELLPALHTYRTLAQRERLGLRVCFHTPLSDLGARIERGEASYADADPWLRLGGVKIFMDGSLGSRSAWMFDPYPDGSTGRLLRDEESLVQILTRAGQAGISGSIHAIGDATVALVCRAVARAGEAVRAHSPAAGAAPRTLALLHRIEHAQCVRPAQVDRIARHEIYCAMQAVHLADDIPLLPRYWPTAAAFAYPFRSLLRAGVTVGLGSDAPVAPLDPRAGIFAAVARRPGNDPTAAAFHPEQAMTSEEALAAYTLWAARGGGREHELGSITPGKLADLTVFDDIDEDAMSGADPEAWLQARVRATIVAGEPVYSA